MKTPEVRQFATLDELIACVGNPQEFAKQLRQLKAAETALNDKYKLAGTLQDGEAYLAEASAKLNEARDVRRHADEILAAAKGEAERITADAAKQADQQRQEIARLHEEARGKLEAASGAMEAAKATEAAGQRALSEAQSMRAEAAKEMAGARAIRTEYGDRLSQLKKLATG